MPSNLANVEVKVEKPVIKAKEETMMEKVKRIIEEKRSAVEVPLSEPELKTEHKKSVEVTNISRSEEQKKKLPDPS